MKVKKIYYYIFIALIISCQSRIESSSSRTYNNISLVDLIKQFNVNDIIEPNYSTKIEKLFKLKDIKWSKSSEDSLCILLSGEIAYMGNFRSSGKLIIPYYISEYKYTTVKIFVKKKTTIYLFDSYEEAIRITTKSKIINFYFNPSTDRWVTVSMNQQ